MDDQADRPREVKRRRRYPTEYKNQILSECAEPGVSVAAVARRHGINDNMVYNWRKAQRQEQPSGFVRLPAPAEPTPERRAPLGDRNVVSVELPSPHGAITVRWPLSEMASSVPWLKALLA